MNKKVATIAGEEYTLTELSHYGKNTAWPSINESFYPKDHLYDTFEYESYETAEFTNCEWRCKLIIDTSTTFHIKLKQAHAFCDEAIADSQKSLTA